MECPEGQRSVKGDVRSRAECDGQAETAESAYLWHHCGSVHVGSIMGHVLVAAVPCDPAMPG